MKTLKLFACLTLLLLSLSSPIFGQTTEIDLTLLKGNWDFPCSAPIDSPSNLECSIEWSEVQFLIEEPYDQGGVYQVAGEGYKISEQLSIVEKDGSYFVAIDKMRYGGQIIELTSKKLVLQDKDSNRNYIYYKQKEKK